MAKKYRIREGSIADRAVSLANKIDTEPFATLTFFGFLMLTVGVFVGVINSAYPIV